LTYKTDVMIPIEFYKPSLRRKILDTDINNQSLTTNLDVVNELRNKARIREEAMKKIQI